jgi:hypothetical protein
MRLAVNCPPAGDTKWWNDIDRGKLKDSEKTLSVPVPLCPPEVPHRLIALGANPDLCGEKPATGRPEQTMTRR